MLPLLSGEKIFFASLDWGLGHATRSTLLLQQFLANNEVIIGVSPLNEWFYVRHFPAVPRILLPAYNVVYSAWQPAWLKVLRQLPRFLRIKRTENRMIQRIVEDEKITALVSDSRFGLYSEKTRNILISHQLQLQLGAFGPLINLFYHKWLSKFSEIWVPDYGEISQRLSGDLSSNDGLSVQVRYIGPQSHLISTKIETSRRVDLLLLLSGPEPQRSLLEHKLCTLLKKSHQKVVLVRGSETPFKGISGNIEVVDYASGAKLAELIRGARKIVCRSGFSTLMDLHLLGWNDLILVPTPGQPEQEYLAAYWHQRFGAVMCSQNEVSKKIADWT